MKKNREMAEQLNALLAADRAGFSRLLATRLPVTDELADTDLVIVGGDPGAYTLGPLGLLNGLSGCRIAAETCEDGTILRFRVS
jgi:uracil-DNA glycosylase